MVYEDENVKVDAYRHYHGGLDNFGFCFTTEDRKILWAGDGQVSESYMRYAEGADLLISEICTEKNTGNSPWGGKSEEEKEKVIWAYHMKPEKLADLGVHCRIGKIVLIHESNYSSPYNADALFNEFKQIYNGDVSSSRDGDVY